MRVACVAQASVVEVPCGGCKMPMVFLPEVVVAVRMWGMQTCTVWPRHLEVRDVQVVVEMPLCFRAEGMSVLRDVGSKCPCVWPRF